MENDKAAGYDDIGSELLKYGGECLHELMSVCHVTNNIFKPDEDAGIGKTIFVPIPKPGKNKGVLNNLRPVTLLASFRKLISLITISSKVETVPFAVP